MGDFKKFNPEDLPIDGDMLKENPLKGDLNVEQLVFRQIERTCQSALQDESLFAANVRLLLSSVPSHKREAILEREDEYKSTQSSWQYKYFCGVPLGTPEEPINGSPAVIEEEIIDWHKLFEIILTAFEDCGVTWKFDRWTLEVGAVETAKPLPPPTPTFNASFAPPPADSTLPSQSNSENQPQTPAKYQRPCAICGQHVAPGTGQFYLHKIVHKKECLDLAKVKWTDKQ